MSSEFLPESQSDKSILPQREALEEEPGYLEEGAGLSEMDMSMATSADQYDTFEEDEDQLYMQQAPSDTLIALQDSVKCLSSYTCAAFLCLMQCVKHVY